jgi:hypothetical protein
MDKQQSDFNFSSVSSSVSFLQSDAMDNKEERKRNNHSHNQNNTENGKTDETEKRPTRERKTYYAQHPRA